MSVERRRPANERFAPGEFPVSSRVKDLLGDANGGGGIGNVMVGPDALRVVLGEHGSAHHDRDVRGLRAQKLDGTLHRGQRRGHERGEADESRAAFDNGIDNGLRRHVAAKVNDCEAVVLEQHAHDVLADVVDVALDGRDDDRQLIALQRARPRLRIGFAQYVEGGFGGFG